MKATDYFSNYESKFFPVLGIPTPDQVNKIVVDLIYDFSIEIPVIIKARNAIANNARMAIVKEQNQKWNALCRLFEKKHKVSPLKRDGFMFVWKIANNKV